MNGDTILEVSYENLLELLELFQIDGLNAKALVFDLQLDNKTVIQKAIKDGIINVKAETIKG